MAAGTDSPFMNGQHRARKKKKKTRVDATGGNLKPKSNGQTAGRTDAIAGDWAPSGGSPLSGRRFKVAGVKAEQLINKT